MAVTATCLLLVRHGETRLNREHVYFGKTDAPLTAEGRHQAECVAERIMEFTDAAEPMENQKGRLFRGSPADRIISSPLGRAMETARILQQALWPGWPEAASGMADHPVGAGEAPPPEIQQEKDLEEIYFGAWEGLSAAAAKQGWPEEWSQWGRDWLTTAPPGQGECFNELYARVTRVYERILREYAGQKVLVVSHHGPLRVMLSHALGLGAAGTWHFQFFGDRLTCLEIVDGYPVVKCVNR